MSPGKSGLFGGYDEANDPLVRQAESLWPGAEAISRVVADLMPRARSLLRVCRDGQMLQDTSDSMGLRSRSATSRVLSALYRRHRQGPQAHAIVDGCLSLMVALDRFQNEHPEEKERAADMAAELAPIAACLVDDGSDSPWQAFRQSMEQHGVDRSLQRRLEEARERFVFPEDRSYRRESAAEPLEMRDAYQNLSLGIGIELYRYSPWVERAGELVEGIRETVRLAGKFGQAAARSRSLSARAFFRESVRGIDDPDFLRLCHRFAEVLGHSVDRAGFSEEDPLENLRPVVSWLTERLPSELSVRPITTDDVLDFAGAARALLECSRAEPDLTPALVEVFAEFVPADPAAFRMKRKAETEEDEPEEIGERIGYASCSKGPPKQVIDLVFPRLGQEPDWPKILKRFIAGTSHLRHRARAIDSVLLLQIPMSDELESLLGRVAELGDVSSFSAIRTLGQLGRERGRDVLLSLLKKALKEYPKSQPVCTRIAFALGTHYAKSRQGRPRQRLERTIRGLPPALVEAFGRGSGGAYQVIPQKEQSPSQEAPGPAELEPVPSQTGVSELLASARKGPLPLRVKAIGQLVQYGTPEVIELLIELLGEKNTVIQQNALMSLLQVGEPSLPFLEDAIETACSGWRKTHKAEKAIPLLQALCGLGKKGIEAAQDVLGRLTETNKGIAKVVEELERKDREEEERQQRQTMLKMTPREIARLRKEEAETEQSEDSGTPTPSGSRLERRIQAYKQRREGKAAPVYELSEEEAEIERKRMERARRKALGDDADKIPTE